MHQKSRVVRQPPKSGRTRTLKTKNRDWLSCGVEKALRPPSERQRYSVILVGAELTIWQTAAAPSSEMFILVGTAPLVPIILGYMAFVYWLFRGKVREGEGYH